jgi:hypothetical protein
MVWMSARVTALKGPILHIITACTSWWQPTGIQVSRYVPTFPRRKREE